MRERLASTPLNIVAAANAEHEGTPVQVVRRVSAQDNVRSGVVGIHVHRIRPITLRRGRETYVARFQRRNDDHNWVLNCLWVLRRDTGKASGLFRTAPDQGWRRASCGDAALMVLYLEAQAKAGGQAPLTLNPGLWVTAGHTAVGYSHRKDLGLPRHIVGLGEYRQGLCYGVTGLKVESGKGLP